MQVHIQAAVGRTEFHGVADWIVGIQGNSSKPMDAAGLQYRCRSRHLLRGHQQIEITEGAAGLIGMGQGLPETFQHDDVDTSCLQAPRKTVELPHQPEAYQPLLTNHGAELVPNRPGWGAIALQQQRQQGMGSRGQVNGCRATT